jgi:YD repeat-containing protein
MAAVAAPGQTVPGPVSYSYDELGRLVGVVANTGDSVRYSYDAIGNIVSITRYAAGQSAIFEFHPKSGPVGTAVTISGSNFSANAAQDTVTINGTPAVVSAASATSLVVSIPTGATTGTITFTSPSGSVTSSDSFTVTNSDGRPRIDSFSPQIVAAGTAVTIAGANFDPTPSNDRIAVNVTRTLSPTSASSTSMTVTAPSSTGSGHISLSTPNGNVVTTSDLFIPPAIYSVSSVASTGRTFPGSPATIALAAPNQIGLLLFDGNKGQMVSATVSSGATFSGCTFYIYSPANSALLDSRSTAGGTANSTCGTSGGFFDSQTLPITGTYALTVVPGTATGQATFTPYVFNDIQGGPLTLGSAVTTTTTFPGQNANYTFSGIPNQHISISIPNSTFHSCYFEIINPDGTFLVNNSSAGCTTAIHFFDVPLLAQTGTYRLIVDPLGAETGSVTFKLNDATDVTGTITTDGTPVTVATPVPGQQAKLTFNGNAGQVIAVLLDNNTYLPSGLTMTIVSPNGSTFKGTSGAVSLFIDDTKYCSNGFVGFVCGSIPLPISGTYTLSLAPSNGVTGQARVRIFTVPSDYTASGPLGGSPIPVVVGTPEQNGRITFTATQGGRIAVGFNNASFSGVVSPGFAFEILQPDGTLFAGPLSGGPFSFSSSTVSGFIDYNDKYTFPVSGTYTLILDPANDTTGSINVSIYDATDQNLNVNADGSPNSVSITSPGQNGHFNFVPAIGQKVSALVTNLSFPHKPALSLQRVDSSGNIINVQPGSADGSNLFLDSFIISQSGSYFLFVDPFAQEIGSGTLTLYNVSDINTVVDTLNDPVTVTTTVPGQNANLTFSANAGQSLTLTVGASNFTSTRCHVNLQNPAGSTIASGDCATLGQWSAITAGQTGTYTIVVDPVQSSTGSETVSMRVQ